MVFILVIVALLVLLFLIWYMFSYLSLHRKLPAECALREWQTQARKRLGVDVDMNLVERDCITVDGGCLYVDVLSVEQGGPTVVFMPGTAAYAELYIEFIFALHSKGFNVVGFDPRGHGRSCGPRGDFTIQEMVDDAIEVARYAKRRFGGKVGISGSSQGGVVSFYVAATGEVISAAMCHNFAVLDGKDNVQLSNFRPPQWAMPFILALFYRLPFLVLPVTFYISFPYTLRDGTPALKFLKKDPGAVVAYSLRAMSTLGKTPMAVPVEQIKTPIMLIGAKGDKVFPPAFVERIFERLTCKKRYVNFDLDTHLILVNYVKEVIEPIAQWFDETLRH